VATLANAHFVDSDINGSTSAAVPAWDTTTYSEQKRAIAHPTNYAHLEGQTVDVLQDGVVSTDATITSGAVVPALTGTTNHVGLNYISTLKPSKLDLEGMGLILTKKITKAIVSFYNTLKGKVGPSTGSLETVSFGTTLFTGIKEVPLNDGYDREGDVIVRQDEPLPMITRGMVLDLGAHNK
jgi:hypothetical protein